MKEFIGREKIVMTTKKTIVGVISAIFILILSQLIAQLIGSGLIAINLPEFIGNTVTSVLYVCIAYLLLRVFAERYLKTDLKSLHIPKFNLRFKWCIIAVLLPIMITFAYLFVPGSVTHNNVDALSVVSSGVIYMGIAAGIVEEMVFRGIILTLLEKRWNKKVAIVIPSLLFGVVHILGYELSPFSAVLVVVAGTMVGIMFSMIVMETKSVWNSGIVHVLWNAIIIGGIFQISSMPDENALFNYVLDSKSFALTGGDFGIEASVISLIGYVIVAVIAVIGIKKKEKNCDIENNDINK